MEFNHIPVLLEQTISLLNLSEGSKVLDGTFGHGGHSRKILEKIGDSGLLVANDRDQSTAIHFEEIKNEHGNILMTNFSFSELEKISLSTGVRQFDGIILDLGVSSEQFDSGERGFSFKNCGTLDMRMDKRQEVTAEHVINTFEKEELEKIFLEYGEEWNGRRIAEQIIQQRKIKAISTTDELMKLVEKVVRKRGRINPATKVFQALRIYVNNELGELEKFLDRVLDFLNTKGRLAIISFHSLEDRIVKGRFNEFSGKCMCNNPVMECCCKKIKKVTILTKKPVVPERDEILKNRRSRSAKLRVIEKN